MNKQSPKTITPKRAAKAYFILLFAVCFYPLMIGLFLWLYVNKAHWSLGLLVILGMIVFDPIWGILFRKFFRR